MKFINSTILLTACVLFLVSCGGNAPKNDEHEHDMEEQDVISLTKVQYDNAGIILGDVQQRNIGAVVKVNGKLDVPPQQMVSVSVPIGGFVKYTKMLIGDKVRKGQVLATLENLDYIQIQQDYLDVGSQYEYSRTEYNRQQELARENINAKKKLQQAKANYNSLEARFDGLKAKLKLMNISADEIAIKGISSTIHVYSPIAGYVSTVGVNVGQFASPQDVLFRIVNTEHMHVELTVFEKDITKLKIGQPVSYSLANENKVRNATVHLIGKEISNDRTVRVHCHLEEEDNNLIPGMYLSANISIEEKAIPALPNSAIVEHNGKHYVFALKDTPEYSFEMEEIKVGLDNGTYSEILNSTTLNDKNIALQGAYALLSVLNIDDEEGHSH